MKTHLIQTSEFFEFWLVFGCLHDQRKRKVKTIWDTFRIEKYAPSVQRVLFQEIMFSVNNIL